jgi:opacity protein-like surface antigen
MNYRWLCATLAGTFVMMCPATVPAQEQNWNVEVAAGVAATTGDVSSRLTKGFTIDFGAGYEFNRTFELEGNFTYNGLGVSNQVLQTLQVPDGNASVMSLTVGPKVHFPIAKNVRGYVAAGAGWYRRTVEFTSPTTGIVDIIDPWWGYLGSAIVPANQVLGSVSDNAWGVNGGGGVAVALGQSGAEFFAEVRYHYAHMTPTTTSIVPVAFGVRFNGQR